MILELALFLIFGLSIGSFLNVLIHRIPKNQSILGRSYCDNCKKTLPWQDLIPIFSFIFLFGKCRFCKEKIDFQTPLVEIITGLMFAFLFLKYPVITNLNLWFFLFFISCLIVVFFTDLKNGIIPNKITVPFFIVSLFYAALNPNPFNHLLSFIFSFVFFFLIFVLTRRKGIGFGDVKLAAVLGLIFGFPKIVILLYLAFLTGGFISLILIVWGKKHLRKDTISFGPFLVVGAVLVLFWGNQMVSLLSSSW